MQALRIIEQVHERNLVLALPEMFWKKRVEVIVMPCENQPTPRSRKRKPSPLLAGTRIIGDIISPVLPAEDWDAVR